MNYHPLVVKTKKELSKLDKLEHISWEDQKKYNSQFLPISVEPKLRNRALKFMDTLIKLLEKDNHSIKFDYNRCHVEMYGQLIEINLRQKYFRKRIPNGHGFSRNTYEKSNKLEFQIGSYARKGWIDNDKKSLEDYLPSIYAYLEKDSKEWADLRERQRVEEKEREKQKLIEAELMRQKELEEEKFQNLIKDASNYSLVNNIRLYLKALGEKIDNTSNLQEYLKWAYQKANELDPLNKSLK